MLCLIYEDLLYNITNTVNKIKQSFPHSSTLFLNKGNIDNVVKTMKDKPLLTDSWLVLTYNKISISDLELINTEDNMVVISISNRGTFEKIKEEYKEKCIKFKYIDYAKPSKEFLVDYVVKELKLKEKNTAIALCKACRFNERLIQDNILLLKGVDNLNTYKVKKYIDTVSVANIQNVLLAILGYKDKYKRSYNSYIRFLYNYKYAYKYLKRYFLDELETIIKVYDAVDCGDLSLENYKSYKAIRTKYLETYIKLRKQISIDYIYFVYESIYKMKNKKTDILILINLLRLTKE